MIDIERRLLRQHSTSQKRQNNRKIFVIIKWFILANQKIESHLKLVGGADQN